MVEIIILKILRSNISMVKKEKIVNLYEYNLIILHFRSYLPPFISWHLNKILFIFMIRY